MPELEFHFDFGSPNAYLAHQVIPVIESRLDAKFRYVPVLLGGVFKATGNASPSESLRGIKNKPDYALLETKRFIRDWNIAGYRSNPYFPVNTLTIMRGAVYAKKAGCFEIYVDEVYRAMWQEGKKMDDVDVIHSTLTDAGLPVNEILEGINKAEIKQELIRNTENSVARGNFGSPAFFVGEEMFFGKDKLHEVQAEYLRQSA